MSYVVGGQMGRYVKFGMPSICKCLYLGWTSPRLPGYRRSMGGLKDVDGRCLRLQERFSEQFWLSRA